MILLPGIALFGDSRLGLLLNSGSGGILALTGDFALWLTDLLGIVAAIAISIASLCYSRNWPEALKDLAIRLLMFRIIIWLMALIMLEVGIIGKIFAAIIGALLSISIPQWIPELLDKLSYAALLGVAYLAVIGGTWTVCRDHYNKLLETGHVDILAELSSLVDQRKKPDSD